jgi:hypothetical protein
MRTFFYIFISIFIIGIISCKKPVEYPFIPSIKYKSFELKDTIDLLDNKTKFGILTFSVIDGDGDIGLDITETDPPFDTTSIYYHNLFMTMYEKVNGVFDTVELTVPANYRIPYAVQEGQNKTLKADIKVQINFYFPIKYDTIKYDFYIYDRSLNKSNVESTPEIILK